MPNLNLTEKLFLANSLYQQALWPEDVNMFCDLFEPNKIYVFMSWWLTVISILLIELISRGFVSLCVRVLIF